MRPAMLYGKAAGMVVGFVLGMMLTGSIGLSILLAIVGIVLGHFAVDVTPSVPGAAPPPPRPAAPPSSSSSQSLMDLQRVATEATDRQRLVDAVCPLFVELARVDEAASQPEVRVIREYFQHERKFPEAALEHVRLALKRLLGGPVLELDTALAETRAELRPVEREPLVRWLYDMALVDGAMTNTERQLLKKIVDGLNLSDESLQQITARLFGGGEAHYAALGLPHTASDDEIRSAFRRLAAENHPDRFAPAPPDQVTAAATRFRAVKDAYDALRQLRGL
ncbi:MAG: TerB family tellurite resistance protein [Archangium sp.]|nr:TerB family tellurite resistance protein [Archangium sp.]